MSFELFQCYNASKLLVGFFIQKYDEAPDRPQSIKAYQFLKSRYPERHFRLVLINVDLNELTQCRKKFIASAVAPSCSVLDDSIGCVLWFAARGEGFLLEEQGTGVFMKLVLHFFPIYAFLNLQNSILCYVVLGITH